MQEQTFLTVSMAIAVLLVSGCSNPAPSSRFSAIADAYCECTTPLARLNQALDTLGHEQLLTQFRRIEAAYRQARECMVATIGQYGLLQAAELDSLTLLLQQRCPEVAHQRDLLEELLSR